jgi:lysophospholipase
MRRMKRPRFAQEITTPLLVVAAGRDRVVQVQAVRDFVKNLPNARYLEIKDSEHEILMESDSIRARFWAAFDAFVKEQLRG